MSSEETKDRLQTVLDVAMKVSLPILLGATGWTFNTLWNHENRIVHIESSRYTQADAKNDLGQVRVLLETIKDRTASEAAASRELLGELRVQSARLSGTIQGNSERMQRLEQRLTQLVQAVENNKPR